MKIIKLKDILTLLWAVLFLFGAGFLNEALIKPDLNIKKQESAVNINSDFIHFLNAGHSRLISDLLWIITLLESDHEHYQQRDLNSWMYLRFKTIMTLDPLFLQNYQFGGKYLSIVKDDIYGAKEIFDKGLTIYPDDYELLFNAAYLYGFELQDDKVAYKLYSKVASFPQAPPYIKTLAYKLKFESTQNLELALQFLKDSYLTEKDVYLKEKILKDMYAIQAQIDLACLNNNGINCNRIDMDGNKYIKSNGKFIATKPFIKYGIKRKLKD